MGINETPSNPRRKGRASIGCGCALVILLFSTFILFPALNYGWDALVDAPWAHSINGRPTLTGTWTGEFTSPSGVHFAVLLDLRRTRLASGNYYNEKGVGPRIDGLAQWCDNQGRRGDNIRIGGNVPPKLSIGYRDSVEGVHLFLEIKEPAPAGPLINEFNGSWHTDTLTLTPTFIVSDGKVRIVPDNDPDLTETISVTLKKGDQSTFDALCQKLKDSSS